MAEVLLNTQVYSEESLLMKIMAENIEGIYKYERCADLLMALILMLLKLSCNVSFCQTLFLMDSVRIVLFLKSLV